MIELPDAEARRRILEEFGSTFFVEAAAGTGKTTALVGRLVELICNGVGTLNRIVAVTFTEKAAGEMKLRLRSEIEKARSKATQEERVRLDWALEELELARIGTIHAFCGDLLHERPIEAGIDPLFEVASEEEAEEIADAAFEDWFQTILADPPEGVRRILRRRSRGQAPREQLRGAMQTLRERRDFPAPWRRQAFDRNGAIDTLMTELSTLGALAAKSSWLGDYLTRNLAEISRFVDETTRLEAVRDRDYDGLEADLRAVARWRSWTWKGAQRTTYGSQSRDEVLALRDRAKVNLDVFIAASDADLAPLLHEALQTPIRAYEFLKTKAGRLDFLDLLIKARDLIRDNAAVRRELQQRFTYFFVDEFQDTVGRPTLVALPIPRPYGDFGKIVNWRIDESFPEAVGAFITWLVHESGWTVEEDGHSVPIRPRHIAILLRRFRNFSVDVTRAYVRALEGQRIPHVLVGGRSFHDREEIIALRNALTAIEWPDDELKVFATLRGPFFAIGDEALLVFRQQIGSDGDIKTRRLNPTHVLDRTKLNPAEVEVADALDVLRLLHVRRNYRPIAETISTLLETLRAHAGIALWPNGEQALANCQRLIDMARHFERDASSFRAFIEKLEADAEQGEADEAPIVEEGVEGVRVMTVHKAKGLEFPVVVLADPTCAAARDTPSRHVEPVRRLWVEPLCGSVPIELLEAADDELRRDHAEAVRVAYVATTRARDLLVAPVCGDGPIEGWLDVLKPVLYPLGGSHRNSGRADGCPAFGEDSVLDRGLEGVPPAAGSVRPGLHRALPNGPQIVWWDPTVLALEIKEHGALRHQRILEIDSEGTGAAASEEGYAAWKEGRETLLSRASLPTISVQTATALARSNASTHFAARPTVQIEKIERIDPARPGGRRFGALVHAMLASVDLAADIDAIRASAVINGRLVGATEEETQAAIVTVRTALRHPLLERAAASARRGELRREALVLLRLDDGSLVEGVVDLAFREDVPEFTGWTVLDFKTDREFETSSDRYETQVALYAEALRAATGLHSRGMLLIV
jgi:ATP-dependent exoDNAse (exonuclease V) beta subunit